MQNLTLPPLEDRPLTGDERTAVAERVDELLELTYRSRSLGNHADPLDELVYILLSRQTRENVYQRIFRAVRAQWSSWQDVRDAPLAELKAVLGPAGFGMQRASQLVGILDAIAVACEERGLGGQLSLDWLSDLADADAERFLMSLPGVGPKSARCVLHYSLGRDTFAVDTHARRIFHRLGLVTDSGGKVDHTAYDQVVRPKNRRRLHINLVHHGRSICRSTGARCRECPLISFCPVGRNIDWSFDARPVAVELFAGGGGMAAGFSAAGFRPAIAIEWDREAAQTYRMNHPGTVVVEADARTVTDRHIKRLAPSAGRPDIIIAGPPCQGYSVAGKREPHVDKNTLFHEVTRLAVKLRPRLIAIENVPGIRKVGGISFSKTVLHELQLSGYAAEEHLLRACDFGVPQLRRRIFFLAKRGVKSNAPTAPNPTHCAGNWCNGVCGNLPGRNCGLPATPTVLEVLKGLPPLPHGVDAEFRDVDGIMILNGSTMRHSQSVINKMRDIAPGKGPISYRRIHVDMARTIVAGHRALPVHPILHRTISVREAARIQSFDDTHVFCGFRANQPLQVANAVPPLLAKAVGDHLMRLL